MANKLANEIELVDAFDATNKAISNIELVALVAALSTRELTANGIKRSGSSGAYTYAVDDETKFAAWLNSVQPEDQQAPEADSAKVWLSNNSAVHAVEISDDDLIEGIVKAVSIRRSRVDRTKITGIGFRLKTVENGVVRNRRIGININYAKTIIAGSWDKISTVTDKQVEAWMLEQKEKGVLIQVTRQVANETGYYVLENRMNDREKKAWDELADKTKAHRSRDGKMIGFVHLTSGLSFSISSELTDEEVDDLNDRITTAATNASEGDKARQIREGEVAGDATKFERDLEALKRAFDKKLINKAEYDIRRAKLLDTL